MNSHIQEKAQELMNQSDVRGNKENVNASFSLDEEQLAYNVRSELGEIDYKDNHADLDEKTVNILAESENILEITTDFEL